MSPIQSPAWRAGLGAAMPRSRGTGGVGPSHSDRAPGGNRHGTRPADVTAPALGIGRHDLLKLNDVVNGGSQVANALSTAHDALGVIGGVLDNVGAVLEAADSPAHGFDVKADQLRIDSAVSTIDAVAVSARFGGRALLDGTYEAAGPAGPVRLPGFAARDLGKSDATPAGPDEALTSLTTGGANALMLGRLKPAAEIVAAAKSRVAVTQDQIQAHLRAARAGASHGQQPPAPPAVATAELLAAAAHETLADPAMAAVAVANSDPQNVFGLLRA